MKKILAALALLGAVYFVSAYKIDVKFTENTASACDLNDPGCGG